MKRRQPPLRDLVRSEILAYSGLDTKYLAGLPPLRDGSYRVSSDSVGGEAPKDFIQVYEYGKAFRSSPRNWPAFIAKVGHKWYPNESITEHLLTRIGQSLELPVADSRLMMAHGQLRFLSRYFLRRRAGDQLIHGAEIFAGYLARESGKRAEEEMNFVEEVESADLSRNFFTFQFVEAAIRSEFPDYAEEILGDFVRLLTFDALVGNNDRHFFNWGVVTDIRGRQVPRLAPIYDTARALFWNTTDQKLAERADWPAEQRQNFLRKYVKKSFPKTGWEGLAKPTHFEVVARIAQNPRYQAIMRDFCEAKVEEKAQEILNNPEFTSLISDIRRDFVVDCLALRCQSFREAIQC